MRKIDQETVEAARAHGKDYANKVGHILELARCMFCVNYGYDWPNYRRIVSQRSRALKAFRIAAMCGRANLEETFNGRLSWDANGNCSYVVGQSSNEEITNLLRQMARMRGGWVS